MCVCELALERIHGFSSKCIKPGAHEREQLSKMSREAINSAVSSRVRVNFREVFASRGCDTKICLKYLPHQNLRAHGKKTAELTASRDFLLSCFLLCALGLSPSARFCTIVCLWRAHVFARLRMNNFLSTSTQEPEVKCSRLREHVCACVSV